MNKQILSSLLIFLGCVNLWAQAVSTRARNSDMATESMVGSRKNLLSLDAFPMALGGYGVGFDRIVNPKMSLGIFTNSENVKANNSGDNSMKLQATGVRGRFFMTGDSASRGWYLGAALVSVNLDTTARVLPTDAEGSADDRQTGFLGSAGYQIRGKDFAQGSFLLNLAVLGGTGMGAKFDARSTAGITRVNTSITSGLGGEATLGFLF